MTGTLQYQQPSGNVVNYSVNTVARRDGNGQVLSGITMNIRGEPVTLNFVQSRNQGEYIALAHQSRLTDMVKENRMAEAAHIGSRILESNEFQTEMRNRGVAPATYTIHTDPAAFASKRLGVQRSGPTP